MMLTWVAMRQAALFRHALWNVMFEGSCPEAWKVHKDIVRMFYGF